MEEMWIYRYMLRLISPKTKVKGNKIKDKKIYIAIDHHLAKAQGKIVKPYFAAWEATWPEHKPQA